MDIDSDYSTRLRRQFGASTYREPRNQVFGSLSSEETLESLDDFGSDGTFEPLDAFDYRDPKKEPDCVSPILVPQRAG